MRPYIFFAALVASWLVGYSWWTVLGDSWFLTSTSGALCGWIGCVFANHLTAAPSHPYVVSPRHPARFDKLQATKGR